MLSAGKCRTWSKVGNKTCVLWGCHRGIRVREKAPAWPRGKSGTPSFCLPHLSWEFREVEFRESPEEREGPDRYPYRRQKV